MSDANTSHCRVCTARPCIHDWQSHAEHLAAAISRVRDLCDGPLEPGCICVSCVILRALAGPPGS